MKSKKSTPALKLLAIILVVTCHVTSERDKREKRLMGNIKEIQDTVKTIMDTVKGGGKDTNQDWLGGNSEAPTDPPPDNKIIDESPKDDSNTSEVRAPKEKPPSTVERRDLEDDNRKRKNSAFSVRRVDPVEQGHRSKRQAYDHNTNIWPGGIVPFMLDPSYPGSQIPVLGQSMDYMQKMSSVRFCNITGTNTSDPNWCKKFGLVIASFLLISGGSGCSASAMGPRNDNTTYPMLVSPCNGLPIIIHELLHTLGFGHSQNARNAQSFFSVQIDNIRSGYESQYSSNNPAVYGDTYDSQSFMSYSVNTWSKDGTPTYIPNMEYLPSTEDGIVSNSAVWMELGRRYAFICDGSNLNCGPGYPKNQTDGSGCVCVCPPEMDPNTGCTSVINGPNPRFKFPTSLAFFSGSASGSCPSGSNPDGNITICGSSSQDPPLSFPTTKYASSNYSLTLPVCVFIKPNSQGRWSAEGQFCFIKVATVDCPELFSVYTLTLVTSKCQARYNGVLADIKVSGGTLTINFCCRSVGLPNVLMDLPNDAPIVWISSRSGPFAGITGMIPYPEVCLSIWDMNDMSESGSSAADFWLWGDQIDLYPMKLINAIRNCNLIINLSAAQLIYTFSVPRQPNRICVILIYAETGGRIVATINGYDLDPDDSFSHNIIHQWMDNARMDNANPKSQLISIGNFMAFRLRTTYRTVSRQGVNITVKLIQGSDLCYNNNTRGADYMGDRTFSSDYRVCKSWLDAWKCYKFPGDFFKYATGYFLDGKGNNSCRNPGGVLFQPFCIVSTDGRSCEIQYCDVCNKLKLEDKIKNCNSYIMNNSAFCQTSPQKYACAKSCNLTKDDLGDPKYTVPYANKPTCGTPPIPSDGVAVGGLQSSYKYGETVLVACKNSTPALNETPAVMLCKEGSWTSLPSACAECPDNFTSIKRACVAHFNILSSSDNAQGFCVALGGTLFQPMNAEEYALARQIRKDSGAFIGTCSHIGMKYDGATGIYSYRGTNQNATYVYRTDTGKMTCQKSACVAMYQEYSTTGRSGGMECVDCGSTQYNFFCEIPIRNASADQDIYPNCKEVVLTFPSACKDPQARRFCKRTCGLTSANTTCTAPTDPGLTTTSPSATVNTGDYVTQTCSQGYCQTSGNTDRFCSENGTLFGKPLVCSTTPSSCDVNVAKVRTCPATQKSNLAVIFDLDRYLIPVAGKIVTWYINCKISALVYLLVYQKSTYTPKGNNSVNCQGGVYWSYNVSTANQITVAPGDRVGIYTPVDGALCITDCTDYYDQSSMVGTASCSSISAVQTTTNYSTKKCFIPILGYTIQN